MPITRKNTSVTNNNEYISNGISISPSIPQSGESVIILYDGILAKSGANHIYAYIGYGDIWQDSSFFKMDKTTTGFQATIPVSNSDTMNFCFKDCANNWDNNSGKNYSIDISR